MTTKPLVGAPRREDSGERGWSRLVLAFRAPQAASAMLVGMGAHVRVLAPASVADDMVRIARDVVGAYPRPVRASRDD